MLGSNIRLSNGIQAHCNPRGFTLLEMMIVLAIMAVLLVLTVPVNTGKMDQTYIAETKELVRRYQPLIEQHYRLFSQFPANNHAAGLPDADNILGNYLTSVELVNGAMHLTLGNKIRPDLKGKILTVRPIFVPDTNNTLISWICGNDTVPENMIAAGENRSDVPPVSLPLSCR